MTTPLHSPDDLRASLHAHADILDTDPGAHVGRGAALRTRIRRARNRRRAGIAGGLAAAVLAAGGVVAGLTSPAPHHDSAPQIAGTTVERNVTVTGFGYRLAATAQSAPGAQTLTMELPKTDRDRVIELVSTGLGAGTATLRDRETDLARVSGGSRLAVPVPVATDKHKVTVVLRDAGPQAQVGLAVYERDGTLPDGVSDGTAVFRSTIGAAELRGGVWARPGRATASFTVQGPIKAWRLAGACALPATESSRDVMLDERVDGKPFAATGCDTLADRSVDPGLGTTASPDTPLGPGRHTITIRLVRGHGHGTPVQVAGAAFGAALYDVNSQELVHDLQVDRAIERNGRNWTLENTIPADNAQVDGPAYVMVVVDHGDWRPIGQHLTAGDRDMVLGEMENGTGSYGSFDLGEVLAGSTYRFWLKHPHDPTSRAAILVYRPAG